MRLRSAIFTNLIALILLIFPGINGCLASQLITAEMTTETAYQISTSKMVAKHYPGESRVDIALLNAMGLGHLFNECSVAFKAGQWTGLVVGILGTGGLLAVVKAPLAGVKLMAKGARLAGAAAKSARALCFAKGGLAAIASGAARASRAAAGKMGKKMANSLDDVAASLRKNACFTAGTQVATPQGNREIETLTPGDKVYTCDESTGERCIRTVTRTFVRSMAAVVAITLSTGEVLHATEEHPFRVVETEQAAPAEAKQLTGEWVTATELQPGDTLVSQSGEPLEVVAKEVILEPTVVHNLEIEGQHTYFVGVACVLVHNTCVTAATRRAMGSKPPRMAHPHIHHIAVKGNFSNRGAKVQARAQDARDALSRHRIDLHGTHNLVWAENRGHTDRYIKKVSAAIIRAEKRGGRAEILKVLTAVKGKISTGTIKY